MSRWEKVRLGDVCTINPPKNKSYAFDREMKVSFIPMSNVFEDGRIITDQTRLISEVSSGYTNFIEDDILFAKITPCMENGKGAIARGLVNGIGVGSTEFHVMRPSEEVTSEWIYWIVSHSKFRKIAEKNMTGSGGQKRVPKSFLENVLVPLPRLEEQRKITKILDNIAELLAMRKQQLAELDNLIKSLFYEMFGDSITSEEQWEVSQLQKMIDENYIVGHLDGNHGNLYPKNAEFVETGIPYIGANCIDGNKVNYNKAKYLSVERASQFRKGVAIKGDVLFAHNATVGPVAILETLENYVILSTSLTFYRCNPEKINNIYLMCYMKSPMFVGQYSIEMGQTTRNQVPISTQRRFLFLLPPLDLQNQFAEIVTKIEEQKALVKKAIDETQLLFDSLMSEYFD